MNTCHEITIFNHYPRAIYAYLHAVGDGFATGEPSPQLEVGFSVLGFGGSGGPANRHGVPLCRGALRGQRDMGQALPFDLARVGVAHAKLLNHWDRVGPSV